MRFIGETRRTIITVGSGFLLRPVFSPRLSRDDEVSTARGRGDTSFNPTREGAAATRQVSPNDLSSKKLLRLFLLRVTDPAAVVPSSAARYFFVACTAIASLFAGHGSASSFCPPPPPPPPCAPQFGRFVISSRLADCSPTVSLHRSYPQRQLILILFVR